MATVVVILFKRLIDIRNGRLAVVYKDKSRQNNGTTHRASFLDVF
jgi:hypothetical protein